MFFVRQDPRQTILTVFNWADTPRSHTVNLAEMGLAGNHNYQASDVLHAGKGVTLSGGAVRLDNMDPHSVRVIKLVDGAVPAAAPSVTAHVPSSANVSQLLNLTADAVASAVPALSYNWDFGDGAKSEGASAVHAYTRPADYTVRLTVNGLDGVPYTQTFPVKVGGLLDPASDASHNTRYSEPSVR
jgi:hypothetical protein